MDAASHPDERSSAASRRLSHIFADLAANATEPVSIAQIRDALGDRGLAALLVLFAAINLLPLPPGSTLVLGLPLILISAQMVLGYTSAWLPRSVLDRTIAPERFRASAHRLVPLLQRLERLVRPRNWPFTGDRTIGAIALLLSICVTLPIPLGNWLPAFAIALLGLALSERDGNFFAAGVAVGALSVVVVVGVVGAAGAVATAFLGVRF